MTATVARECVAVRSARVETPCEGPVKWAVVYRTRKDRKVVDVTAGCFRHCLGEADRANAAGQMATADVEELAQATTGQPCWREYDCNHDRCWELRAGGAS